MAEIDFTPPAGAREEAARGLAWREEFGRGGTAVGVARARDIKNGTSLSPRTIRRMVSYFARHEVDKKGQGWSPSEAGYPSAGRIAWALWGGDAGRAWANKVSQQLRAQGRSMDIDLTLVDEILEIRIGNGNNQYKKGKPTQSDLAKDVAAGPMGPAARGKQLVEMEAEFKGAGYKVTRNTNGSITGTKSAGSRTVTITSTLGQSVSVEHWDSKIGQGYSGFSPNASVAIAKGNAFLNT